MAASGSKKPVVLREADNEKTVSLARGDEQDIRAEPARAGLDDVLNGEDDPRVLVDELLELVEDDERAWQLARLRRPRREDVSDRRQKLVLRDVRGVRVLLE